MIAAKVTTQMQPAKVTQAVDKAKYENMKHAAFSIRKDAAKSVKQRKNKDKPSPPGEPPFAHTLGFLKKAIWTDVKEDEAIVGFRKSVIGMVAATHEHGLTEDGRDYPERPTMAPALERNVERFHSDWRSSVG